jgi:GDPmannose 4,6-dehydratase
MKRALITGITGQDGSLLARFLLDKGYEVHGIRRRTSTFNTKRIDDLIDSNQIKLYFGDMTDSPSLFQIINKVKPNEIYNLAAQSHVGVSFETPEYTANADAIGVLRILETIRQLDLVNDCRFYQASTSELFGNSPAPQNELTQFAPRSPYAVAKLYAHWITINYREAYNIYAVNGILFNHESSYRGETFVTQKIIKGLLDIRDGKEKVLLLGNLDSVRDWGHAKEYVEIMWKMLQQEIPDDYVIATGKATTVREFIMKAANKLGLDLKWSGKGINEIAQLPGGKTIVKISSEYFRPTEVNYLLGDSNKARNFLDWNPKITLDELIDEMILHADNI